MPMAKNKSKTKTNSQTVRAWREKHGLTVERTATLARVTPSTVNSWMLSIESPGHREPQDGTLELLAIKLGEPLPFGRDW